MCLIPNWYKACGNVDRRGGIFKTWNGWLGVAEECLPAAFFCTAKRSKSQSRPEEKSFRLCCGCPMGRIETRRSRSPARQFALIHRDRWLSQVEAILAPADFSKGRRTNRE